MSNTNETIDVGYVANLARIELTDEEKAQFQTQLGEVLTYVHQLDELDLDGIEPTAHGMPMFNVLREDVIEPSLPHDAVMANAPKSSNGHIAVPKIMDNN